jgi:hypothetical protein
MISILFVILASICNAIMDVCSFHYSNSIFNKLNPKYWNPEISWKNKYIDCDPTKGMRKIFFGLLDYPVFLTDAWHLFKSLMIIFLVTAIVLYKPLFSQLIDFVSMGIMWNFTFNFFYNVIFKR